MIHSCAAVNRSGLCREPIAESVFANRGGAVFCTLLTQEDEPFAEYSNYENVVADIQPID